MDDVRRDEAADAARPELHPERADAAEKSVGRERGDRERHAWRRQLERRVAPAVERDAQGPCTPVVARFAERSCGVRVAGEPLTLPREGRAWRSPKPPGALPLEDPKPQARRMNAPETLAQMRVAVSRLAALRVAR